MPENPAGTVINIFTEHGNATTASILSQLRDHHQGASYCRHCCPVPTLQVKCANVVDGRVQNLKVYPPPDRHLEYNFHKTILPHEAAAWILDAEYRLFSILRGNQPEEFIVAEIEAHPAHVAAHPDQLIENNLLSIGGCQ